MGDPIKDPIQEEWRRRKYRKLREMFNESNILETIKKGRLY